MTNSFRLSLLLDTLAIGTLCPYCFLLTSKAYYLYEARCICICPNVQAFYSAFFDGFVYQFITLRLDILVPGGVNVAT